MKIFIHHDRLYRDAWHERYIYLLTQLYGIQTELVDFLHVPLSKIATLVSRGDGLIGRWGHVTNDVSRFRQIADAVFTLFAGRVFPSPHAYLYYDDKARQASLFLNKGYPTPATAVVGSHEELTAFLAREKLSLPIVAKTIQGAQSSGVRLMLHTSDVTFPCLVQRYCPGNSCDYRVVVIGHRVMGFIRRNRDNDFRASGSRKIVHVQDLDPALIAFATRISSENSFESMAYDFVKLGQQWVVLEMSYTYPHWTLRDCEYYYDVKTGERVQKRGIYPEDFIVEDFLAKHYPHVLMNRSPEPSVITKKRTDTAVSSTAD